MNKVCLAVGNSEHAMAMAMLSIFSFYNASLPLGALLEPKLLLFREQAVNLGKPGFVMIFSFLRQFLYNLQGGPNASSSPTVLDGSAFHEGNILAKAKGPAQKMISRDAGSIRLKLAVIFDDEATMEEMLLRLDPFPVHDIPIARQFVRMSYTGFASLILEPKTNNKYKKWADTCIDFFDKLTQFGSPNAQPVFFSLLALRTRTLSAFDKAIHASDQMGLLNLNALMNERCGMWLLSQKDKGIDITSGQDHHRDSDSNNDNNIKTNSYETYLKCAIWAYHDYGAQAKVAQLKDRFSFLASAMHEKPPSQLSSVRKHAALMGLPKKKNAITATVTPIQMLGTSQGSNLSSVENERGNE